MAEMELKEFSQTVAQSMCGVASSALVIVVDYGPNGHMEMHSAFRGRPDLTPAQHEQLRAFFKAMQDAIKENMSILDPAGNASIAADYISPRHPAVGDA